MKKRSKRRTIFGTLSVVLGFVACVVSTTWLDHTIPGMIGAISGICLLAFGALVLLDD